jgi:hypothetical protein
MHETDLELEPNEASDLCRLQAPALLEQRGWDRAFLTVLDEAPVEECVAVLGHERDAEPGEGWEALRVKCEVQKGEGKTHDAEACAGHGGWVYLLGSQYGGKQGPLDRRRSWIARGREEDLAGALAGDGPARLELARLDFAIHRAVNDALRESPIELIALGAKTREEFIDASLEDAEGAVEPGDHPINVEGADFRAGGGLLLGLRYPTSAEGYPLLVELSGVSELFEDNADQVHGTAVWTIEGMGSPDAPSGVRGLHADDGERFDAVVGDVDVEEHPEGEGASSAHVRFSIPRESSGGGAVTGVRTVHEFGDQRHVEGVADGGDGHMHYVIDRDGRVALRTLLVSA